MPPMISKGKSNSWTSK